MLSRNGRSLWRRHPRQTKSCRRRDPEGLVKAGADIETMLDILIRRHNLSVVTILVVVIVKHSVDLFTEATHAFRVTQQSVHDIVHDGRRGVAASIHCDGNFGDDLNPDEILGMILLVFHEALEEIG